jgi:O-antigen/teichoic acid export membrane protein
MAQPTPAAQPLALQPAADDGVRITLAGLVLWAVALVACVLQRDTLAERGAAWWTWSAACGLIVGLGLLGYCVRRARVYREHGRTDATGAEHPMAGGAG